jgi:hypothetical protein
MKNIILIFLGIFIMLSTHGQDYVPMLGETNTWYYTYYFENYETLITSTLGDTLIDGKLYKMLSGTSFLREDSIEKRIYLQFRDWEFIYFDFSLETGDTILIEDICYGPVVCSKGNYIVDSLGAINTLAGQRKTIYLSGPINNSKTEHPIWIEGIGSLSDFNNRYKSPGHETGELSCFYKDSVLIYRSNLSVIFNTCEINLSGRYNSYYNNILIYPNPFNDFLNLEGLNGYKMKVEIFDITGRPVYSDYISMGSSYTINTGRIDPGLYILRIYNSMNITDVQNRIIIKKR